MHYPFPRFFSPAMDDAPPSSSSPSSSPILSPTSSSRSNNNNNNNKHYFALPHAVKTRFPIMNPLKGITSGSSTRSRRPSLPAKAATEDVRRVADYEIIEPAGGGTRGGGSHVRRHSSQELVVGHQTGWKFANQGLNLLESSVAEFQSREPSAKLLSRQLYIHGLTYLLRGLPSELTNAELTTLSTSLPGALQKFQLPSVAFPPRPRPTADGHNTYPYTLAHTNLDSRPYCTCSGPDTGDEAPTLLHRFLACAIVQAFIIATFVWPYLQRAWRAVCAWERENHVTERAVAATLSAGERWGNGALELGAVAMKSGNGYIAAAVARSLGKTVKSVAGGVQEGLEGGAQVLERAEREKEREKAEKEKEKEREREREREGKGRGAKDRVVVGSEKRREEEREGRERAGSWAEKERVVLVRKR